MLLDDLGAYLQTAGVGTLGVDLFLSGTPASPDTLVALLEYGGLPAVHRMSPAPGRAAVAVERPNVQVLARSTDYPTARARAERAFRALDGYAGVLGSTRYGYVSAHQSPYLIQRDVNDRVWLGFGCTVTKAMSSS